MPNSGEPVKIYQLLRREKLMRTFLLVVVVIFSHLSFAKLFTEARKLSVMTYNVQNLFDTHHDEGKEDWTYLPFEFKVSNTEVFKYCNDLTNEYYKKACLEKDWNQQTLERKMQNLARVIRLYKGGVGADVVVLQEVENKSVLKMLFNNYLKDLNYGYFSLIEGPDRRGIDVAVVSRYPILEDRAYEVELIPYSSRATRTLLEVVIKVHGKLVTVFANHWPSQRNSDETRRRAARKLEEITLKSASDLVVAAGDFNTSKTNILNSINSYLLAHYEDVEVKGRAFSQVDALGTHWYRGKWESLDKILVLKRSLSASDIRVDYTTFDILNAPFMLRDLTWTDYATNREYFSKGIPHRFNDHYKEGYSDHLPVVIEFQL